MDIEQYWFTLNEQENENELQCPSNSNSSSPLDSPLLSIVLRLWHEDVFLGATRAGVGDPGANCCELLYEASSGLFLRSVAIGSTL